MEKRKNFLNTIVPSICLIILILDTKTALLGAKNGITLCLNCVIPSLLPFCILSKIICASMLGKRIPVISNIGRMIGMPQGSESILLLSFLGGYPIGAQCINDAYRKGAISKADAGRMLAFCNNAGPAFLFGMLSGLFSTIIPILTLFMIQIISALLVGYLLPNKTIGICKELSGQQITLPKAVEESLKTMAFVCGWVIIFRIILQFFEHWFLLTSGPTVLSIVAGFLELSNGCIALQQIELPGLRYVLSAVFLSFGGSSVALQTISVTQQVGIGQYFPGKLLQTVISFILASITQFLIFPSNDTLPPAGVILVASMGIGIFLAIFLRKSKKVVAFAK